MQAPDHNKKRMVAGDNLVGPWYVPLAGAHTDQTKPAILE